MEKKKQIGDTPKGFVYNPELDKYSGIVLFPEKMKKVTDLVKDVPPPKSEKYV